MFIYSPKELALILMSQRKKLKLSQAEVGKLVGLKQQTISDFEKRPERTQIETLFRILAALKLDMAVSPKNETAAIKAHWKEEW